MIIYSLCKVKGYSFDEKASTPHCTLSILCTWTYFVFCIIYCSLLAVFDWVGTMKRIFCIYFFSLARTHPASGPWVAQQHFHNVCFEPDEMWCVNYHRLDEPWVPPGSNCPHHRSDCKLTNSAGHQLMKCLHQKGKVRRDDGIIRYLCCFYVWYSGVLLITVAPGTVSAICFITKDGN